MKPQANKPILFASDLTPEMKHVFHYAAVQAISQNTGIIILHVIEKSSRAEGSFSLYFGKEKYQNLKNQKRQEAHKALIGKDLEGNRIRQAIAGYFGEQEAVKGSPSLIKDIVVKDAPSISGEIIATASEEDCGMIIIGCRKQGVISSAIGDHVVREILKKTNIPVLAVPYSEG